MKYLEKGIKYVKPGEVRYDINNPRGEKEHQIISDKAFKKLLESIVKYGVLEPLIVKNDPEKKAKYFLIDGERRLRAAKIAAKNKQLDVVPILKAKDDTDGRILAYQVHMLRKQWEKASETKAIKMIISDLKKDNPDIFDKDILKKVKEVTGHTDDQIADLLKLAKYDDSIIDKVIQSKILVSQLIQNEASFIMPLKKYFPEVFDKYGEDNIRNIMVEKAEKGLLHGTRFLMDKFKYVFKDKANKSKNSKILDSFLSDKNLSGQDVLKKWNPETYREIFATRRSPKNKKKKEGKQVSERKAVTLTEKQSINVANVRKGFEDIGRSLSKEEFEYIAEALTCVENGCLRASIVMIWGATLSKVLKYIDINFASFKSECATLNTSSKPYKYFKDNYKKVANYTNSEELRNGNDLPLIAYLLYKDIINNTEYKKLVNGFNTRCDCAHPTKINLTPNEAIAIFHSCFLIVFRNKKLK